MTRNFYGKKMFIADLIITTIWVLFTCRYALFGGYGPFLYIFIRIALCFEMQRKSPWTLYSAIAFLLCMGGYLIEKGSIIDPVKQMVYQIGCMVGHQEDMIETFGGEIDPDVVVWLHVSGAMLNLWLVGLPIVAGILVKNIRQIEWRNKGIWIYVVAVVLLTLCISCYEFWIGESIQGFLLSFLPVVYWCLYRRDGRSALDLLSSYRPLMYYLGFVLIMFVCLLIGYEDFEKIKILGLVITPVAFYALLCRCFKCRPILTRHALILSVAGFLYIFVLYMPKEFKITTLSLSALLTLCVAVDLGLKHRSILIPAILFIGVIGFISPVTLGLNPYVALDVKNIGKYHWGYVTNNGMFITAKDGKVGLRDRYGEILKPEYEQIQKLGKWNRYISVLKSPGTLIAEQRFGVYDLATRKYILHPDSVTITEITPISELSYRLTDLEGQHFATLHMPGPYKDRYLHEVFIEPYYSPVEIELPNESDITAGNNSGNDSIVDSQHEMNLGSYNHLDKMKAKALAEFKAIINKDAEYYKVYTAWHNLLDAMSGYLIKDTYGAVHSTQPLRSNPDIREWYEDLLPILDIDSSIIFNKKEYTSKIDTEITADENSFFVRYNTHEHGGYNGMWSEIKPAYDEWKFARAKFAESLSPHQRLSFEEHTKDLRHYIFNEIRSLAICRNDTVLCDREEQ